MCRTEKLTEAQHRHGRQLQTAAQAGSVYVLTRTSVTADWDNGNVNVNVNVTPTSSPLQAHSKHVQKDHAEHDVCILGPAGTDDLCLL